ncbi:MAG: 2-oxoglutarate dehydrogenase E1 component [Alphaproteobacteria bacterium]|nr:2-oxoglutarate dehydrogenase E1 component [Rhodospirillales bacterium]MCW9045025.1 2-oxoglutarate dehydrogenase E1 component [Alphaproteobacteria bacterium]
MTVSIDSLLSGSNAGYIAELYSRYLENPNSVDPSWGSFFSELQDDGKAILDELRGASWADERKGLIGGKKEEDGHAVVGLKESRRDEQRGRQATASTSGGEDSRRATLDSIRALMMIRTYRVRGHLIANFDPLGIEGQAHHPELDPESYGFGEEDMDRPIFIDHVLGLESATVRQILKVLKRTYCGSVGVEFMHMQDPAAKSWIQRRIESANNRTEFTLKGKQAILERLTEAEGFENYLHVKFPGTKRFGIDGGESLMPAMEQILKRGAQLGIKEVILGMPHRGRLNVLVNVMRKPYVNLFSEFQGTSANPDDVEGSGDVKYHLGTSSDRLFDGNNVHLSLNANPSHLEAVNTVVLGKVRAKQVQREDVERRQVMGILLHGDAAFAGQGLVAETLDLSELKGYRTGGTIHFIVNNQIGFTTAPHYSRSSQYPTDVAKMVQAPIFHVNGDDPEAVVHVARMAAEFRQEFKRDVVIDMFCYRRYGHNEGDEPLFTNPIMYKTIAKHPTTRTIYAERLVKEGVLTQGEADKMSTDFQARMAADFETATTYKPNKADWLEGKWEGLSQFQGEEEFHEFDTAVDVEKLKKIGYSISRDPDEIKVNSKIIRQLKAKAKMMDTGMNIDWATAEALAFGSILEDGKYVRLSGQDSGRGTFSHRHSVLVDQDDETRYVPLNNLSDKQAHFEVIDSPLSELAVLGFEYGYTLSEPNALVMWEAQFGDFANGAHMIVDQFIASGESKWLRFSGVVMLLPHGMEGQGPEHSSARIERYLQGCAEDNMQVVNITTPANYFHALRRQVCRNFRKPLISMAPKSLLRHKLCVSTLADMGPGSHFQRVIPETDTLVADKKVKRIVLCSGKVYYDLLQKRRDEGIDDVAIIRIEQLYPWPKASVKKEIERYPNADLVWCQEESANQGGLLFVRIRLGFILDEVDRKHKFIGYAGRKASASPATGLLSVHNKEQALLVEQALTWKTDKLPRPFTRGTPMGVDA